MLAFDLPLFPNPSDLGFYEIQYHPRSQTLGTSLDTLWLMHPFSQPRVVLYP